MVFLIMNQLAESPVYICRVFWLAIRRMKNSTSAGAIRFRAVPPMVWSAFRLMAAKANSSENSAPNSAATAMASTINPCSAGQFLAVMAASNQPHCCTRRTNKTPMNAPKIIMPSSARLMMPLRSAKMPASATIIRGTA